MPYLLTLRVRVMEWHDGDTFKGYLVAGNNLCLGSTDDPIRFRCALINSPELPTVAGVAATTAAAKIAPPAWYMCTSYKPDTYGRPLVDLLLPGGGTFSKAMLDGGWALPYVAPSVAAAQRSVEQRQ